jgi:O-antigen/teichoic acid export membrane protein
MASKIVKGTLILSIATLLTRMIGALFWVPFQNIAGDEVVGVYKVSYPFYATLLMIASAGIPLTISKFVSDRVSVGDHLNARQVLKAGSLVLSLTGLLLSSLLFFGADFFANVVLENPPTKQSLQVLALAILIVPLMAALRGYFQGHQNMMPTGLSQVVEQLFRVGIVVLLTYYLVSIGSSTEQISAGATLGAGVGALAGLLIVLWYYYRNRHERRRNIRRQENKQRESIGSLIKTILVFSLPITLGQLVYPIIQLLDSATVPRLLRWMGNTPEMANTLFGIYGRGEPFVNLIQSFSTAIGLTLVPAIAAYVAKKQQQELNDTISKAWMMTLVISLPMSLAVSVLARPLNIMMYKDDAGWLPLAVLSFAAIFSTVATASTAILQGLGYNRIPVRNLIIGGIVKVIGNFIYVPMIGIAGSALSMVICYLVVCILNMWAVIEITQARVRFSKVLGKPFLSGIFMSIILLALYLGMEKWIVDPVEASRISNAMISIVLGLLAALIYFVILLLTRTINESELKMMPMGGRLVQIFKKIGLLRG